MALKQQESSTGDYLLTQFPATKGLALLKQLTKLLGPSFAELSGGDEENAVKLAVSKLVENLDSVKVEELVKYLVTNGATKGTMSIDFDNEFAGEYAKMFNLVREIVEFNFGDVFTLLGSDAQ